MVNLQVRFLCGLYQNIIWDSPLEIEEAKDGNRVKNDNYGIYQIYGTHPIYGSDSLLYIGKSQKDVFSKRMNSHQAGWINFEPSNVKIYFGRLAGGKISTDDEWEELIDISEKMLIYFCQPSYNVREKYAKPIFANNEDFLVINLGKRHRLPAEISSYFINNYDKKLEIWKYKPV